MDNPLRVASICAGVGGLDLAIECAAGARTVVYVEREAYPAACLLARMEEKAIHPAPIWCGDVAELDWSALCGLVDVVAAGFPCQPSSCAGDRKGLDDERWLWPEIARAVRELRPRFVFLENVAGLVTVDGGMDAVLGSLASLRYDAEWICLRASDVGAPHDRARIFILAYADRPRLERRSLRQRGRGDERATRQGDGPVAHTDDLGELQPQGSLADVGRRTGDGDPGLFPPGADAFDDWRRILAERPDLAPNELPLCRVANGLAEGVGGREPGLRAVGNGVVPLQAAVAFRVLAARFGMDWS